MWAHDGMEEAFSDGAYPRHGESVIEPDGEFHCHANLPTFPPHDTDQIRVATPGRHEINHGHGPFRSLKPGLKNERMLAIFTGCVFLSGSWSEHPSTILGRSQERCKTCVGIETRPTQPIDRTAAAYKRDRFAISYDPVIFNGRA